MKTDDKKIDRRHALWMTILGAILSTIGGYIVAVMTNSAGTSPTEAAHAVQSIAYTPAANDFFTLDFSGPLIKIGGWISAIVGISSILHGLNHLHIFSAFDGLDDLDDLSDLFF